MRENNGVKIKQYKNSVGTGCLNDYPDVVVVSLGDFLIFDVCIYRLLTFSRDIEVAYVIW